MTQADPPKEASAVEKMNGRSLLLSLCLSLLSLSLPLSLSSNKMTHCFKECRAASGVLKRIYCFYKNFIIKIDPLNSSCSKKTTVPRKKTQAISTPKEQLFRKSSCSESHPCKYAIAVLKNLLYLMNHYNYYCEINKLTHSP